MGLSDAATSLDPKTVNPGLLAMALANAGNTGVEGRDGSNINLGTGKLLDSLLGVGQSGDGTNRADAVNALRDAVASALLGGGAGGGGGGSGGLARGGGVGEAAREVADGVGSVLAHLAQSGGGSATQ